MNSCKRFIITSILATSFCKGLLPPAMLLATRLEKEIFTVVNRLLASDRVLLKSLFKCLKNGLSGKDRTKLS